MNADPLKLARFTGASHVLLRVAVALTFMSHGTIKLLGFPQMPAMPGGPPPMPSPPLLSLLGIAGLMEIVGGMLVFVGLFTRPVAFLLAGQMAVAYWLAHAPGGFAPAVNMGEPAYLFCFIFLWLSAAGSGPWALDNRLGTAE